MHQPDFCFVHQSSMTLWEIFSTFGKKNQDEIFKKKSKIDFFS